MSSKTLNKDKDNVKVAVRCRPFNSREKKLKSKCVVNVDTETNQIVLFKPNANNSKISKSFTFDYVYDNNTIQKDVYEDTAYPLVESVLEGYNGTIFAYGQTGCGKTWTMEGVDGHNNDLRGIIPNSFQHIFDRVNSETDANKTFLIRAGYIEIYNEEIRDLLNVGVNKQKLNLREDPEKGVYIDKLTMITVKNVNDTQLLMDKGKKSRSVGETAMNAVSSRSHAIFIINVETSEYDITAKEDKIKASKLNLVDLAGSERQSKTRAKGVRFKEATKINLSLSALGNVISALVEGKGKGKHIPYRDSKLTRLLQDSLGGNTKTVMIACVSPADDNYDETLSTLRYANRAKNIKNKPKINEDPKDTLLRKYQDEIKKLKTMLANNQSIPGKIAIGSIKKEVIVNKTNKNNNKLSKEYAKLKQKFEKTKKYKELQESINNEILNEKGKEIEDIQYDMTEQIYLLESQLLEGGNSNNNDAIKRLNEMKKKRMKRKQQKKQYKKDKYNDIDNDEKRIKKWKLKYKYAVNEIEDLNKEFEKERTDLLHDIRNTYREMSLYRTIIYKLIPSQTIDDIMYQSKWNSQNETWILPDVKSPQPPKYATNQSLYKRKNKYMKKTSSLYIEDDYHDSKQLFTPQTIDNFDLSQMKNVDEFTNVQGDTHEIISKDINIDHDFITQISTIKNENKFNVNNKENDLNDNGIPNKTINVDNDFIAQLSTINDIKSFKSENNQIIHSPQTLPNKNSKDIMDFANLMIENKPSFEDEMEFIISPTKHKITEHDDILTQMMTNNIIQTTGDKKTSIFQEKQDIVDITTLHKLLNKQ